MIVRIPHGFIRFGLFVFLCVPAEPPQRQDPSVGKAQGPSNEIPSLLMSSDHQQAGSLKEAQE
jgi:hypothetical protein